MATNIKGQYGQSEHGNFKVVDIVGVPHPYCITPKHVAVASDRFGGSLNEAAIEEAERRGAHCGVKGCQLSCKQHETALLVGCLKEIMIADNGANPELHAYLLSIKDECKKNGYAGFAFMELDSFAAFDDAGETVVIDKLESK